MPMPDTPDSPSPARAAIPPARLGILAKTALAFAAIGVLATLATAAGAYGLYGSELEKAAARRLDAIRALTAGRVDGELESARESARAAAELLAANLPLEGVPDPAQARALLQAAARQIPAARIALCDAAGGVVAASEGTPDAARAAALVRDARPGDLAFAEAGAFGGGPSLVHLRPLTKESRLPALLVEIPFTGITRLLVPGDAGVLGETGEIYLVDAANAPRSPLRDGRVLARIETDGVRDALGGETGHAVYANYAGTRVLGSYTRLKAAGFNWVLIAEQSREEALRPAREATLMIAAIGAGAILLIVLLGVLFAKWLSRPLLAIQDTVARLAQGDETARAPVVSSDEIGQLAASFNRMVEERNAAKERVTTENRRLQSSIQELLLVVADASEGRLGVRARRAEGVLGNVGDALNRMLANVGVLIGEAKRASAQVDHAAGEIAASAQDLADGTARQSGQTTRALGDVETLTGEARAVAENSRDAALAAARAREAAEEGARAVRGVEEFMERLRANVEASARKITRLGERSQEISGIVRSIGDISAEVDVLAMNASIEAARAGEQGRGFSIVADQVRALADRARQATVEIEKLVAGIQSETAEAVRQMDQQNREVDQGARQAATAGKSLVHIVEAGVDSSALADQISQSARAQEERARQVAQAVGDIHRIAEDARARTLEFRGTSDRLAALAGELNKRLENFEVGAAAPVPPA